MLVNTYYLHFEVGRQILEAPLTQQLEKHLGMRLAKIVPMESGGLVVQYTGPMDSFATVRCSPEGIVNITIEHFAEDYLDELVPWRTSKAMSDDIAKVLGCRDHECFSFYKRAGEPRRFYCIESTRIINGHSTEGLPKRGIVDMDKIVFEEKSAYQLVQISSCYLGNVLFLDGHINLAAKESAYTRTIMQQGKECYRDKEILILGGGDGALLYEILKEKPKYVVMIEIDEVVIRSCRTYLTDVNGGVLDEMNNPRHEIIIGDCFEHLTRLIGEGRKFDFVFDDLNKRPICGSVHQSASPWSCVIETLNLSLKVLKHSGKIMCHCGETSHQDLLKTFENNLKTLHDPVNFSTDVAFVPAIYEFCVFYQIWRQQNL